MSDAGWGYVVSLGSLQEGKTGSLDWPRWRRGLISALLGLGFTKPKVKSTHHGCILLSQPRSPYGYLSWGLGQPLRPGEEQVQSKAEQQADFLSLSLAWLDQHRVLPMFKRQQGRMGEKEEEAAGQSKARDRRIACGQARSTGTTF